MFDDIIQTNLKGTFLVNQIAARSMIGANLSEGSIINISSVSGQLCCQIGDVNLQRERNI